MHIDKGDLGNSSQHRGALKFLSNSEVQYMIPLAINLFAVLVYRKDEMDGSFR